MISCRSLRKASTSLPDLPITIPGRAVWMSTETSPRRSIVIFESPAWESLFSMWSRMLRSSSRVSAKPFSSNQFDFQSWM